MAVVLYLKNFWRRAARERTMRKDEDSSPAVNDPTLITACMPRIVILGLRAHFKSHTHVENDARLLIDALPKVRKRFEKDSTRVSLAHLLQRRAISSKLVARHLDELGWRFANTSEFIGFISTITPREEMHDWPIVALGTDFIDQDGCANGIAYLHDRGRAVESIFLIDTEFIRPDWFLLLAHDRIKSNKKCTP